ncbi:hypothetical protein ACB092_12G101100 [Castanea dentata]
MDVHDRACRRTWTPPLRLIKQEGMQVMMMRRNPQMM